MLMPKKNRVAIYEHLFREGVMVAKKDFHAAKHPEVETVPNLHVIKALTSLKSRGFVKEQFSWRHYYWYLTNEGIQYLRDFLHLPPEIVPASLKRAQPREPTARARSAKGGPEAPKAGDRSEYRKGGFGEKKEVGAGAEENIQFRGGFGRGRRRDDQE